MNAAPVLATLSTGVGQAPLSPSAMVAHGWTRQGRAGKTGAWWLHADGWRLLHCGHPTALFPWALYAPGGAMICTGAAGRSRNPIFGMAWPNLRMAVGFVASPESAAFARLTPSEGR